MARVGCWRLQRNYLHGGIYPWEMAIDVCACRESFSIVYPAHVGTRYDEQIHPITASEENIPTYSLNSQTLVLSHDRLCIQDDPVPRARSNSHSNSSHSAQSVLEMSRPCQHRGIDKASSSSSSSSNDKNPDTDPARHSTEPLTTDSTPFLTKPRGEQCRKRVTLDHLRPKHVGQDRASNWPALPGIQTHQEPACSRCFSSRPHRSCSRLESSRDSSRPMGVPRASCGPSRTSSRTGGWMDMNGSVCAPLALELCVLINAGVENTRSLLGAY